MTRPTVGSWNEWVQTLFQAQREKNQKGERAYYIGFDIQDCQDTELEGNQ